MFYLQSTSFWHLGGRYGMEEWNSRDAKYRRKISPWFFSVMSYLFNQWRAVPVSIKPDVFERVTLYHFLIFKSNRRDDPLIWDRKILFFINWKNESVKDKKAYWIWRKISRSCISINVIENLKERRQEKT